MIKKSIFIVIIFRHLTYKLVASVDWNAYVGTMIAASMDSMVQPCDDFYSYACGSYKDQNFFNLTLDVKELKYYANHKYDLVIRDLLDSFAREEPQVPDNCKVWVQKIKSYYEACAKTTERNLTKFLEEVKPGPQLDWPIFQPLDNNAIMKKQWPYDKDFDVWPLLGELQAYGLNNTIFNMKIDKNGLTMEPFSFTNNNSLPDLTMVDSFLNELPEKKRLDLIAEVVETNAKLVNILQNISQEKMEDLNTTLAGFTLRYPNLNFQSYMRKTMRQYLELKTPFHLKNTAYFQYLNDRLWLDFDKEKLCNYLMIKFLSHLYTTAEGSSIICAKEVRDNFNVAMDFLYYQLNYDFLEKAVRPDLKRIFAIIKDMLRKHYTSDAFKLTKTQINELDKKLAQIRFNIGNFPNGVSCERVARYYASIPSLNESNYYKNKLIASRFKASLMRQKKKNRSSFIDINQEEKDLPPEVVLPFSSLMNPLYSISYDNLNKYSIFGFILTQKIIRLCGLENLNSESLNMLYCLLNKNETEQSYNQIADNLATEIARKIATLKFINLKSSDMRTFWKRRFFLRVSQTYCTSNQDRIETNAKRLNSIAMNSDGFAQAFNCPVNSQMNPSTKCQIF